MALVVRLATRGSSSSGAELLPHAGAIGPGLLAAAELSDADLEAFETADEDWLLRTPHGDVWLCASWPVPQAIADQPWLTLRALRDVGRSFASALAGVQDLGAFAEREQGASVNDDAAANDFGDDDEFVPASDAGLTMKPEGQWS